MTAHLVSWEPISLRIDGARANELARKEAPDVRIDFHDGRIHVSGRRFLVPYSADIRQIDIRGKTIVVPVTGLGVANLFLGTIRKVIASRIPHDGVTVQPPLTFIIQLDRFLPSFVELDVREIRMIEGGLAVKLGPGGASWK